MNPSASDKTEPGCLAARLVEGPQLSNSADAERRLDGWLADLEPEQASAIRRLAASYPQAHRILLGIAEASPYLFDLIRADAAQLAALLGCDPDRHLADLIEGTCREVSSAATEADAMRSLRRMKSEAALLIALCDIGDVWPVMRVTEALTELAVRSVQATVRYLLGEAVGRQKLSPPDPERPEEGSGLIVLAMGKMGAGELNYSSDIDLIVFYERERNALRENVEPGPFFVRVAQGLSRILSQRTGEGYVFRVD